MHLVQMVNHIVFGAFLQSAQMALAIDPDDLFDVPLQVPFVLVNPLRAVRTKVLSVRRNALLQI